MKKQALSRPRFNAYFLNKLVRRGRTQLNQAEVG